MQQCGKKRYIRSKINYDCNKQDSSTKHTGDLAASPRLLSSIVLKTGPVIEPVKLLVQVFTDRTTGSLVQGLVFKI
jgi:hypothetical protein